MIPNERMILRRKEVAALAGVSTATVDRWAKAGELRRKKVGGQSRASGFRTAEVYRFLAK